MTTTDAKPKKLSSFILPVIGAIAVVTVLGYFAATHVGLDKQVVVKALDVWAQQMKIYGSSHGENINFAYDDVEMKGAAANRHAIVKQVRLEVISPADDVNAGKITQIATDAVELHPSSASFSSLKVALPDPLKVTENGEAVVTIHAEKPFELLVEREKKSGMAWVSSDLRLPHAITFEAPKPEETFVLRFDENAVAQMTISEDMQQLGDVKLSLANLQIDDAQGTTAVRAKTLQLISTDKAAEDGNHQLSFKAAVDELFSDEEEMPYGAISAMADVLYTGPVLKGQAVDWSATQAQFDLNDLKIAMADAALEAKGSFKTGGGELLPVGSAHLKVKNFAFIRDELAKQGMLDDESNKVLHALLSKAVGADYDTAEHLDLPVSREKGGSLKLGNITFEEALAIVLTGGKIAPAPAPAPEKAKEE